MNIPLNVDIQQILLHLLNFVILFAVLYFLLYKPVKSFMEKRERHYQELNEQTAAALADAEHAKQDYEQRLADLDDEILQKRAQANKKIAAASEEMQKEAAREAKKIVAKARAEAQRQHDKILGQANEEIVAMVNTAAEKLVFEKTGDAYNTFLGEVEGDGTEA